MSRVREAFGSKKSFIGFLTAGDPSLKKTEEFIIEMDKAGAAVIEIGIPFSDPIAEGPVVQNANVRALSAPGGCTTDMVFDMLGRASAKIAAPVVLLTYLNPVFKYGYEAFCAKCKETGVSGIMIPDLPYEERMELVPVAQQYGIDIIPIIAQTSKNRIPMIAKEATGYNYIIYASEKSEDEAQMTAEIEEMIQSIRSVTDIPVVVEFRTPEPVYNVMKSVTANGVIVENAIVKLIEEYGNDAGKYIYEYVKQMTK